MRQTCEVKIGDDPIVLCDKPAVDFIVVELLRPERYYICAEHWDSEEAKQLPIKG